MTDTTYNVTIYRTIRIKVEGIKAASAKEATSRAEDIMIKDHVPDFLGTYTPRPKHRPCVIYLEDGDEPAAFRVDVEGDEEYEQSVFIDP